MPYAIWVEKSRRIAVISAFLLLGLAGCGKEEKQAESNAAATAPATQTTTEAATAPANPAPAPQSANAEPKELNIYNWADYIGETMIADFEKETGIKVRYDLYDSNETLDAKLAVGNTGYDVTFPSSSFFARQIQAGIFQKLDKSKLSNLGNLNPEIVRIIAEQADPGNEYAVPYMWGTNGFTYNVDMIKERMPDAPVDSLAMIFDPAIIAKFADCGVTFLDSPEDVIPLALAYMGKDPKTQDPAEITAAVDMLMKIRPFIRKFDSQEYLNALPNSEICIAMSWSGDYATAAARAAEAGVSVNLAYTVPKEGTNIWADGMLIPADAPHPQNAHLFLNYMLRPDVIAKCTNYTNYANANAAATPLVDPAIASNPAIYPDAEVLKRGYPAVTRDNEILRVLTREWTRFKTGQ